MSKAVYSGLTWAFTPYAKGLLLDLVAAGLAYDLAVAVIHNDVDSGRYTEEEIYELPEEEGPLEVVLGEA